MIPQVHNSGLPPQAVATCTVGSVLKGVVKYTMITVLTIGISQVIAVFGLVSLGIKAISDEYNYAKYMNLQNLHTSDPIKFAEYQSKINIYTQRFKNNSICAKALGLSLVSLSLNYGTGYMGKSFAIAISDIALGILGPNKLRTMFHPISGQQAHPRREQDYFDHISVALVADYRLEEFRLPVPLVPNDPTKGNRTLEAAWIPCKKKLTGLAGDVDFFFPPGEVLVPSDRPTVIFFHGNGMTWHGMAERAKWFRHLDFNVLMLTRGGYTGSTPEHPTTELSSYQDAEAAYNYVKTILRTDDREYSNHRIVAYGHSMGSTDASFIANRHSGVHLITDVALSRMADCIKNILINSVGLLFSENSATLAGEYLVQNIFPAGLTDGILSTNSLNNRERMQGITSSYFGMWGETDDLMVNLTTKISGTEVLLDEFRTETDKKSDQEKAEAEGRDKSRQCTGIPYEGGHNVSLWGRGPTALSALNYHLRSVGLLPA